MGLRSPFLTFLIFPHPLTEGFERGFSLSFAHILHERIVERVFLVAPMLFAAHCLPVVVGRKEGIGFNRRVDNLREQQTRRHTHSLPIDTGPTYYIYILILPAMHQRLLQ